MRHRIKVHTLICISCQRHLTIGLVLDPEKITLKIYQKLNLKLPQQMIPRWKGLIKLKKNIYTLWGLRCNREVLEVKQNFEFENPENARFYNCLV